MKLRVVSDLHFEFQRDGGRSLSMEIAEGVFEVLVVAGDLSNFAGLRASLEVLCERVRPRSVVYVLGNHEAYGSRVEAALAEAKGAEARIWNLTVLEREVRVVRGQRFVGCTLWFPHSGQVEALDAGMADFVQIQGLREWLLDSVPKSRQFLRDSVKPGDVVVTHYLPHPKSVARKYEGSPYNRYFLHDVSEQVVEGGAALWVHGHTHTSCDYRVGGTRVVCNPFGYAYGQPGEPNREFRADRDVALVTARG